MQYKPLMKRDAHPSRLLVYWKKITPPHVCQAAHRQRNERPGFGWRESGFAVADVAVGRPQ